MNADGTNELAIGTPDESRGGIEDTGVLFVYQHGDDSPGDIPAMMYIEEREGGQNAGERFGSALASGN